MLDGKNGALGAVVVGPLFACEGEVIDFSANIYGGEGGAYSYLWEHRELGGQWFTIGSGNPYTDTLMGSSDVETRIVVSRGAETSTSFEHPTDHLNPSGCDGGGFGFKSSGDLQANRTTFATGEPYPNPTTGPVGIRLDLAEEADVTVVVYDVLGRVVLTESISAVTAGARTLGLDADALPPGRYLYRLTAGANRATGSFVVAD